MAKRNTKNIKNCVESWSEIMAIFWMYISVWVYRHCIGTTSHKEAAKRIQKKAYEQIYDTVKYSNCEQSHISAAAVQLHDFFPLICYSFAFVGSNSMKLNKVRKLFFFVSTIFVLFSAQSCANALNVPVFAKQCSRSKWN